MLICWCRASAGIGHILLPQKRPTMAFSNEFNDYTDGETRNVETMAPKASDPSNQLQPRFDGTHWLFLGVAASGIIGAAAVFVIWWGLAERSQGVVAAGIILFFLVILVWGATATVLTYQALKLLVPAVLALLRNKDKVRLDG